MLYVFSYFSIAHTGITIHRTRAAPARLYAHLPCAAASTQPFDAFLVKMNLSLLKIILLLLSFNVACTQNNKPDISQLASENEIVDWKKIHECGLFFSMPMSLKEVKIQPIDSCAKDYRSNDILFTLDVFNGGGKESDSRRNEYSGAKDFELAETIVDGRKAEIITYYEIGNTFKQRENLPYGAVLYVPVIDERGTNLTIWTYSRSAEDRETTKKIFETIRFEK